MKKYLFMVLLSLAISATACGKSAEEPKVDIAEVNTTESEEVATENSVSENENSNNSDGENKVMETDSDNKNSAELLGATYIVEDEYSLDDLTMWDGTGEWKRDSAYQFSMEQYYDGKYYAVDWRTGDVDGEDFPMGVNPTYFLFCDDMFFYMESDGTTSGTADELSNNLYVYSFETGETRLLMTQVRKAAYDQGKIIYEHYDDWEIYSWGEVIIGKVDVQTGEKLYERQFSTQGSSSYLSDNLVVYDDGTETCIYDFKNNVVKEWYIPNECFRIKIFKGNIFAFFNADDGKHCVELYEQGEKVVRVFPQIIGEEADICDERVYYVEDGIAKEYCLETLELKEICGASAEEEGVNILHRAYKAGDAIITVENPQQEPDENGYIIVYKYAIDDKGVKKRVLAR